jgi:PAS domain S-box-containing protein
MPETEKQSTRPAGTSTNLEQEEALLWRIALLFVVLLATGLAAESWERLQNLPYHLGLLSLGLLCIAIAFAGFAYGRRKRVTELQNLVRGLQERPTAPSDEQLDQLGELIARSQRSFKDLIDSFDDIAFAASLEGKIKTVNRRVTELLGIPYPDVVGHRVEEFLDEPKREDVERGVARFLEKRRWSGVVCARLKANARTLYFDCALNAIVKGDEVVGVSALARDVTEEREKERRFTELFETLQEGVYFSTPEGKLLDGNAALVQVLGYESKEDLLSLDPRALNSDPKQNPVLGRTADDQGGVRTREIMLRRKNGILGVFLDTSRAVWDAGGKIVRYQGTLVDVTERREMEKAKNRIIPANCSRCIAT